MSSHSDIELIHALYAFLAEPDRFEDLLGLLDKRIHTLKDLPFMDTARATIPEDLPESEIDRHFQQAALLFDKVGLQASKRAAPEGLEDVGVPAAIVSAKGVLLSLNGGAKRLLSAEIGQAIGDLVTDDDTGRTLEEELKRLGTDDVSEIFVSIGSTGADQSQSTLFTLSRVEQGSFGSVFRLTAIEFGWDDSTGNAAGRSFGLTAAELDVLRGVVEGRNFASIARHRNRSLETVRTQAKSLLRKTGAGTQVGLVRLFAAIALSREDATPGRNPQIHAKRNSESVFVSVGSGRVLQVDIYGPADGRPLVMLHGLFSGTRLTPIAMDYLNRQGLRVLAPWRPGFAGSTPRNAVSGDLPRAFSKDLENVLNHFGIEKTILCGRFTGAIYAAAAARTLPERVTGCALISATPPLRDKAQLEAMAGWQRLFAYSIVYFPAVVPVLVRGMHQFLFRKETAKFMRGFYTKPDADVAYRSDPDVIQVIEQGVAETFQQGTAAHEADLKLTGSDWSPFLAGIQCPVVMLHGEENPVDPVTHILGLQAEFPSLAVHVHPGQGQLFVHQRPDLVFGALVNALP